MQRSALLTCEIKMGYPACGALVLVLSGSLAKEHKNSRGTPLAGL